MSSQANGSRKSLLRTRNLVGGGVLVGVLFGIYFADFFKGPGLGGSGPGTSQPSPSTAQKKEPQSPQTDEKADIIAKPVPRNLIDTVRVLIDERSYFLMVDQEPNRPISLADLLPLVEQAKGDPDGIRVRIYRKTTSRPTAEKDLRDALLAAGLKKEAIYEHPTLVE